jgi:hypothetical protein
MSGPCAHHMVNESKGEVMRFDGSFLFQTKVAFEMPVQGERKGLPVSEQAQ